MAAALAPDRGHDVRRLALAARRRQRGFEPFRLQRRRDRREALELEAEERGMRPRAGDRMVNGAFTICRIHTTGPSPLRSPAQRLKLDGSTYVNIRVKEWNLSMKPMASTSIRRFVKVAPPTVHAGVGDALRQAFQMDGELRCLKSFEDLLGRLD